MLNDGGGMAGSSVTPHNFFHNPYVNNNQLVNKKGKPSAMGMGMGGITLTAASSTGTSSSSLYNEDGSINHGHV